MGGGNSTRVKSNLKAGRFSRTCTVSAAKPTQVFGDHGHVFKKEHINTSICLTEDKKHAEWMLSFKMLLGKTNKVDSTLVFELVSPGLTQGRVEDPKYFPNNFTDPTAAVKLPANAKFEKTNHGKTRRGTAA